MSFQTWLKKTKPIIPVIVIHDLDDAIPLAKALVAGGIHMLEVTLRTEQGLQAISAIKEAVPEAIVGAGTVTTSKQLQQALNAGAEFIISPGISDSLCKQAVAYNVPYAPGIMTPSDIVTGLEYGIEMFKFFPADKAGGVPMLKALSGPFPNLTFCPTGGVSADNAGDYLALSNVVAIGGSWLCPQALIEAKDWEGITKLAQAV